MAERVANGFGSNYFQVLEKNTLVAFVALIAGGVGLHAEIRWESQKAEFASMPQDTYVETKFVFVNTGSTPVVIESVHSSCECTWAKLAKTTYAPGEHGEIQARFNIGGRTGVNTKTISVAIAGERNPTVLTLTVTIPEAAQLEPKTLVWRAGETNAPKMISLRALPGQPIRVLQAVSSKPNFKTRVETVEESKEYRITVTPSSTTTPGAAALTIDTLLMGQKKAITALVQIQRAVK